MHPADEKTQTLAVPQKIITNFLDASIYSFTTGNEETTMINEGVGSLG